MVLPFKRPNHSPTSVASFGTASCKALRNGSRHALTTSASGTPAGTVPPKGASPTSRATVPQAPRMNERSPSGGGASLSAKNRASSRATQLIPRVSRGAFPARASSSAMARSPSFDGVHASNTPLAASLPAMVQVMAGRSEVFAVTGAAGRAEMACSALWLGNSTMGFDGVEAAVAQPRSRKGRRVWARVFTRRSVAEKSGLAEATRGNPLGASARPWPAAQIRLRPDFVLVLVLLLVLGKPDGASASRLIPLGGPEHEPEHEHEHEGR